jgi:hypothetical protein
MDTCLENACASALETSSSRSGAIQRPLTWHEHYEPKVLKSSAPDQSLTAWIINGGLGFVCVRFR